MRRHQAQYGELRHSLCLCITRLGETASSSLNVLFALEVDNIFRVKSQLHFLRRIVR